MKVQFLLAAVVVVAAGCQSAPNMKAVAAQEAAPVNCATAEGDLRMLNSEKVSTARAIADGVTAITPIGLVAGAATRTEGTKLKIASGDYDKAIDKKMAQIKSTCGIQ